VEILCPDSRYQVPCYLDGDSSVFFPPNVPTHWVGERCAFAFRMLGVRNIGLRALFPMLSAGRKLFQRRHFDLVFISSAKFPLFLLGRAWKKRFGIQFILDLHDPCYRENSAYPAWSRPSLKHAVAGWLTKYVESSSVPFASGLVSVSPDYVQVLRRRYGSGHPAWMRASNHAVIPFSVLPRDLDEDGNGVERSTGVERKVRVTVVYVGGGGPVMVCCFYLLCGALSRLRASSPHLIDGVRVELYGTALGWREGDPRHLNDIATKWGLADIV